MNESKKWSIEWAGSELSIEVGKYAVQADAACTCRYGDTEVLATVVRSSSSRDGVDFFPLMVDYEERFYAAGKIKGSRFIKREGRPTDEAILMGRMIDRSIRPLFDNSVRNDVQVILTVFSIDEKNDPDIPAFIAASTALSISPINWRGPVAGIRIGQIDGELVLNPTYVARQKSSLDFVVATTADDKLIMAEAEAKEVSEEIIFKAIELAKKHNRAIISLITRIQKEVGAPKLAIDVTSDGFEKSDQADIEKFLDAKIKEVMFNEPHANKRERGVAIEAIKKLLDAHLSDQQIGKEKREKALKMVKERVEREVSRVIMEEGKRVDGRSLHDIRQLNIDLGIFPRTHGSAMFSRGDTQVASIITLGSPGDVQLLDTMETEEKKHFMHHYNFPPYSVGETAPLRGPGRREIGHGALAEKAIRAVLPTKEAFPYTIRVVSEVLSSNGSSSMASTCGSSLALMDAGVPLSRHVAGIAMGLASNESKKHYTVFTDLQDLEDGAGGMDFKICGTQNGITAIQMDTKTAGLPDQVVRETFTRAREALNQIIAKMSAAIHSPRAELSQYAPRIYTLHIDPEKIGLVIGPGGKTINKIIDATGVDIDIEKDGTVLITSTTKDGAEEAIRQVQDLTRDIKVGDEFTGKVTRLMNFGAFVELTPTQEGMAHISNLSNEYVQSIEDIVKIGDELHVRVIEKDEQGRINLTVVGVEPKPPRSNGPRGNGFNGGRGGFSRPRRPSGGNSRFGRRP